MRSILDNILDEIAPLSRLKIMQSKASREEPFRWICSIFVEHWGQVLPVPAQKLSVDRHKDLTGPTVSGTGLLISPRHVLTCGHILTHRTAKASYKPKKITVFFPGRMVGSGGVLKEPEFDTWTGQAWFHSRVLNKNSAESRSFDFGLIELESNSGVFPGEMLKTNPREQFGWWGRSGPNYFMNTHRSPSWLNSRKVNVYGYPVSSKSASHKLYHGFGKVFSVLNRRKSLGRLHHLVRYSVSTRSGVSGGPIWTTDTKPLARRLIGIHGGTWEDGRAGGLLINPVIAAFLRKHGVKNSRFDAADRTF